MAVTTEHCHYTKYAAECLMTAPRCGLEHMCEHNLYQYFLTVLFFVRQYLSDKRRHRIYIFGGHAIRLMCAHNSRIATFPGCVPMWRYKLSLACKSSCYAGQKIYGQTLAAFSSFFKRYAEVYSTFNSCDKVIYWPKGPNKLQQSSRQRFLPLWDKHLRMFKWCSRQLSSAK